MKSILLILLLLAGTACAVDPPINNWNRIDIWHRQVTPRRFVYAFVADIRNTPKKEDIAYRKLSAQGVMIQLFDIDYHNEVAKLYGVTKPCYLVMQINTSFSKPYVVFRTDKLEDIEKRVDWLRTKKLPRL